MLTRKQSIEPSNDEELKAALSAVETNLVTPVVSGDMTERLESLKTSWVTATEQVQQHFKQHAAQFEEIGSADPELLPRVEQLESEDVAIEKDRHAFDQAVARMAEHGPKLEPDEEKAQQHLKKLVDQGMAFITRVRKQEVAIQTWFVEAFNRDRGASG
jgi:hypothetical protein